MSNYDRNSPLCPRDHSRIHMMRVNEVVAGTAYHGMKLTGRMDIFLLASPAINGKNVNRKPRGAKRFNLLLDEDAFSGILF